MVTLNDVTLYGLGSLISNDVAEWCTTREDADRLRQQVLADEPDLTGALYIHEITLEISRN